MPPDDYFTLALADRADLLRSAAAHLGRPAALLEKDIWVVWALRELFDGSAGPHLVFKGGTSLSKVHRVIDRFSEDVDVTYNIRELLGRSEDWLPHNRSQADRLRKQIAKSEPAAAASVTCDVASHFSTVRFGHAKPRTMVAARTKRCCPLE